jgi:hypothetical protein
MTQESQRYHEPHIFLCRFASNPSHSHRALARVKAQRVVSFSPGFKPGARNGASMETVSTVSLCFVMETVKTVPEQLSPQFAPG